MFALLLCHRNTLSGLVMVSTSNILPTFRHPHLNPVKRALCTHNLSRHHAVYVITHTISELTDGVAYPEAPADSRKIIVPVRTVEAKYAPLSFLGLVSDRSSLHWGTELPLGRCYRWESHLALECSVHYTGRGICKVPGPKSIEPGDQQCVGGLGK